MDTNPGLLIRVRGKRCQCPILIVKYYQQYITQTSSDINEF